MLFLWAPELRHPRAVRSAPTCALPCPGRRHRAKDGLALPWGVDVPHAQPPSTQGSGDVTAGGWGEADSHRWETLACSTWHRPRGPTRGDADEGSPWGPEEEGGRGLPLTSGPGLLPERDTRPHPRGPEVHSFLRRSRGQGNPDSRSGRALCPRGVVLGVLRPLGPALGQLQSLSQNSVTWSALSLRLIFSYCGLLAHF